MPFELYQTQVWTAFNKSRAVNRFFFLANNAASIHPAKMAGEINAELYINTDWLFFYTSLISEKAGVKLITTRRVGGIGASAWRASFPGGGIQGRWLGDMADNYQAATIAWTTATGSTGRYANRIGPLGEGVFRIGNWYPLFVLAVNAFITAHLTVMVTASGVPFRSHLVSATGVREPVDAGFLRYPPSALLQRRWEP